MNRPSILIVDDTQANLVLLNELLAPYYNIFLASNGKEAYNIIRKEKKIDLIILDDLMPVMDGIQFLKELKKESLEYKVLMMTSKTNPANALEVISLGVVDFIYRPYEPAIVLNRIKNVILSNFSNLEYENIKSNTLIKNEKIINNILIQSIEFRNSSPINHISNVYKIVQIILQYIQANYSFINLTKDDIELIKLASTLHDIGKIQISQEILTKPYDLSESEIKLMQKHTTFGYEIIKSYKNYENEPIYKYLLDITKYHHERYDGKGYPDGLKKDQIPLWAQVVGIADVYDGLTNKRGYKKAYSHDMAVRIIEEDNSAFSPIVLEAFAYSEEEIRKELENGEDTKEALEYISLCEDNELAKSLYETQMKYEIFSSLGEEILFEISLNPTVITFNQYATKYLRVDEVIENPRDNDRLKWILSKTFLDTISERLNNVNKENPCIACDCRLNLDEGYEWVNLSLHALFSMDGKQIIGAIGKASKIVSTHDRIKNLEYIARHDMLTGLLNQHFGTEKIKDVLRNNYDSEFALLLIDLDSFKSINDTKGHLFGNKVLKTFADAINDMKRVTDVAVRYGGDEFILLIGYNDYNYLKNVLYEKYDSPLFNCDDIKIEFSIGVATTKDFGRDFIKLFANADRALYYGKTNGKGRITFCDEIKKK